MALLDLTYGQEKYIKDLIVRENPSLIDQPDAFFKPLGDVIAHPDGSASAYLLGDPQDVELQQVSGKVYVRYNRIDIAALLRNTKPLYATNPTSTLQLLTHLRKQAGLVFPPEQVYDDPLSGEESGVATIRLKTPASRCFALTTNEFTVSWVKSPYVELSDAFTVSELDGFPLVLPYLSDIGNYFTTSELIGFTDLTVTQQWEKLSSGWYIPNTEYAIIDHFYNRTVDGSYSATVIADAVNKASKGRHGVFVCEANDVRPNLYNGRITANAVNTAWCGLKKPDKLLEFEPLPAWSGGVGKMKLFYDLVDLDKEVFVLEDSETALRQWLNGLAAPAGTWDVVKAPQLFNVVTKGKFGPWVAVNGSPYVRNLWWSELTKNENADITIDGVHYNRRCVWTPSGTYSNTSRGSLTFYYNRP